MASLSKKAAAAASTSSKPGTPATQRSVSLAKKRRAAKDDGQKVSLDRVLGLTCHSASSLAVSDARIAYPAGNVAVLLGLKKTRQMFIFNKKVISCLSLSSSGGHLAVGECGHDPAVSVWELAGSEDPHSVALLKGHEFGVQCVAFQPGQKYLVSVGYMHDRQIIVWNWKNGTQYVHGKFGQSVNTLAFSLDRSSKLGNSYFVTTHHRRLQYWYFDINKDGNKKMTTSLLLKGRSAVLGDLQSQTFVGVACGSGVLTEKTFAITKSGRLCVFDNKRTLDKFTEVKVSTSTCLAVSDSYLFCGGGDGIIRVFDPFSLDYVISLPRPHPLGVDLAASASPGEKAEGVVYPDTVAMVINNHKLSVVYMDHSLYIWDIGNLKQVAKVNSYLYHNACVWDITTYPSVSDASSPLLPPSTFVTCSSDGTLRFWSLDQSMGQWSPRNLYSKELVRVLYVSVGEGQEVLKDHSVLPGDSSAVADATRGLRCIAMRPDGKQVAVGDREGNVRVYDLEFMDKIYEEVAHDSEVLSLSFSKEIRGSQYLASGSRDRMVHVFSSSENSSGYVPIQSLPDHSASVTAVSFFNNNQDLQLLSGGADKSVLYHTKDMTSSSALFLRSNHIVSKTAVYDMAMDSDEKKFYISGPDKFLRVFSVSGGKKLTTIKAPAGDEGGLLKVTLDPSGHYAATSCADKSILVFDLSSGDCVSRLYGHSEVVTQLKFSEDGKYLYSVSGDSCIFVWRLPKVMIQTIQVSLGIWCDSSSGKGLKSTSVSSSPTRSMSSLAMGNPLPSRITGSDPLPMRVTDKSKSLRKETDGDKERKAGGGDTCRLQQQEGGCDEEPLEQTDFDFRLSMLPEWAQKAALSRPSVALSSAGKTSNQQKDNQPQARGAEGRWEERAVTMETKFAKEGSEGNEEDDRRKTRVLTEAAMNTTTTTTSMVVSPTPIASQIQSPADSPGDAELQQPLQIFQDDSDGEEGVIYDTVSTSCLDVDPSTFHVTTPNKPARPTSQTEEVDVDVSAEDDLESPVDKDASEDQHSREFLSLLTNFPQFELSSSNSSNFLHPYSASSLQNSRLSISAKFFQRHQEQFMVSERRSSPCPAREEDERPLSRDMLRQLCSPPPKGPPPDVRKDLVSESAPVIAVILPHNPPDEEEEEELVRSRASDQLSSNGEMETAGGRDEATRDSEPLDLPVKRSRESFDVAVTQTKKRLEELGYEVPGKDRRKRRKESDDDTSASGRKSLDRRKGSPKKIVAKSARVLTSSKESLTSQDSGAEPALVGKTSAILDSLQINLRSLVLLHEEAVGIGATGVVDAITAGIDSHKEALLSWEERGVKDMVPEKQDAGGRKRSATSPVDMLSKRDYKKRLSEEPEDLAVCKEEELLAVSTLRQGGVAGGDNAASTNTDVSNEVQGGSSASGEIQEAMCEVKGRVGNTSGQCGSSSAGVTLTSEQIKEAKDLMHKLLQYFS